MTIEEYARKRQDLRNKFCSEALGQFDFLSFERTPRRESIAIDAIMAYGTKYQAAVAALDAEFKGEKV